MPAHPPSRRAGGARRNAGARLPLPLLGGLTADEFLRDYWQKKPLLIRGALPGFGKDLDRQGMLGLAARDDVESRLVSLADGGWQLRRGPFTAASARRWGKPWSLLVQGVNLVTAVGDELLRQFDFIPYARLDDLMVSYATDGGGVGPHFDNYDVFLLQGSGRRRWQIGRQRDKTLVDGLPLRILKDFRPTREWVLEPGDMLYLPPDWAHDGVAIGDCMTWSIGFRAPPADEIVQGFLTYLQDSLCVPGIYRDPDLQPQAHPGEIPAAMVARIEHMLAAVRWNRDTVRDFLGCQLTEPKPHVFFDPPGHPLSANRFTALVRRRGLRLDARSQLLFSGRHFFLNGEKLQVPAGWQSALKQLADRRVLAAADLPADLAPAHAWYGDGFLHPA